MARKLQIQRKTPPTNLKKNKHFQGTYVGIIGGGRAAPPALPGGGGGPRPGAAGAALGGWPGFGGGCRLTGGGGFLRGALPGEDGAALADDLKKSIKIGGYNKGMVSNKDKLTLSLVLASSQT